MLNSTKQNKMKNKILCLVNSDCVVDVNVNVNVMLQMWEMPKRKKMYIERRQSKTKQWNEKKIYLHGSMHSWMCTCSFVDRLFGCDYIVYVCMSLRQLSWYMEKNVCLKFECFGQTWTVMRNKILTNRNGIASKQYSRGYRKTFHCHTRTQKAQQITTTTKSKSTVIYVSV